MLFKGSLHFLAIAAACVVIGACGLLPSFGGDGMNDHEKANLNLQMGVRYLDLGMLEVAKEKLETAYDLESGNPETLNALAVFYERIKDDDQAAEFYQAAIGKDPENYSTKNNYGRFLCERGKYEKGMAMLQEALNSPMNQRPWLALSNIGICLVLQNDPAKGEEYLRRALTGNPGYPPALQEMLKISYNNQQYMSARAFLERYLAVAKHTPETLWYGFQTERALGNRQAAENYKEQLLINFPTSTEALQAKSAISK
ncbi:MAG: type IV pilus biogenesis/stability protein PilW [Methylomonas sp.]|jgi:type IV pilus assembly protein PilF|uniref:type IV pilus biogenesis/stability protein PilW n=1 Tax=Methylomonas sp. TaxID=418 RepID=UPI0025DADE23|nr:type IV pilus biogenesis/stability protein PilW [Methylomonas sp.]MCK9605192.1 type IV pilus biogenesis/stability protein PilW [Methylomonas sp.]